MKKYCFSERTFSGTLKYPSWSNRQTASSKKKLSPSEYSKTDKKSLGESYMQLGPRYQMVNLTQLIPFLCDVSGKHSRQHILLKLLAKPFR